MNNHNPQKNLPSIHLSKKEKMPLKKDAFATFDQDLTLLTVNSTFLKILGIRDYNPVNTSLFNLPFFQKEKYATLFDCLKNNEIEQFKSKTSLTN